VARPGLTGEQSANARTVVAVSMQVVGSRLGPAVGRRAAVIAVATAMQESTLRNLAYGDRDSLGLFQQRAAWGSVTERTTPTAATTMFLTGGRGGQRGLLDVPGWSAMPVTDAAQAVQVSRFPTAYAKWETLAATVVAATVGTAVSAGLLGGCGTGQVGAGGWVDPLPAGTSTVGSGFGRRLHPIYRTWRMHTGQDLGAATGTPVYAAAAGTVTFAGVSGALTSGYGNLVTLEHPDKLVTLYGHLTVVGVRPGQTVTPGQLIGRVGSTGSSTGPHLHFQVEQHGTPIDPVPWMRSHGAPL
jgi:murein DD-endopeptidase MepM/ murein hydrolase activator NlpD